MSDTHELVVSADEAGTRLDAFVARHLGLPRARSRDLALAGHVRLEGVPVRPAHRLRPEQRVTVNLPPARLPAPADPAAGPPLRLLHVDDALLVLDKPPGQVCHPAPGHPGGTLADVLLATYPDLALAETGPRPGIVHRLDRDTSGVMVVARTGTAAERLRAQFASRSVEKAYLALVRGAPRPPQGVIEAPIGRDPARRQRMAVLASGRPARTLYKTLAQAHGYAWLEARPETGRTHQIRVHLAAIGHPVVGDTLYGRPDARVDRMALHAWQLAFDHPTTGRRMRFEAPLPADIAAALTSIGLDPQDP